MNKRSFLLLFFGFAACTSLSPDSVIEKCSKILQNGLNSSDLRIKLNAIESISIHCNKSNYIDLLKLILDSEQNDKVRIQGLEVLSNSNHFFIVPIPWDRLLKAPNWIIREKSLLLLQKHNPTDNLKLITPLLKDPHPFVRSTALSLIGEQSQPHLSESVRPLLQDTSSLVKAAALLALARLRNMDILKLSENHLKSSEEFLRVQAVKALSSLRIHHSIPILERALMDESDIVRGEAIEGLSAFYSPDLKKIIFPFYRDVSWYVRKKVYLSLVQDSAFSSHSLILMEKDTSKFIQLTRISLLAKTHASNLDSLRRFFLYHKDPDIRKAAIEYLIRDTTNLTDLNNLEEEGNEEVYLAIFQKIMNMPPSGKILDYLTSLKKFSADRLNLYVSVLLLLYDLKKFYPDFERYLNSNNPEIKYQAAVLCLKILESVSFQKIQK